MQRKFFVFSLCFLGCGSSNKSTGGPDSGTDTTSTNDTLGGHDSVTTGDSPAGDTSGGGDTTVTPADTTTVLDATSLNSPITPGSPGTVDITFTIRSDQAQKAISPFIYGLNHDTNLTRDRPTVMRLGGNRLTAYNWETNASNAGSDYYFENDDYMSSSTTAGDTYTQFINTNKSGGAASVVTIPIVDYVAGDECGTSTTGACAGFTQDIRQTANYLTTRLKANHATGGATAGYPPVITDANVYQDEAVTWLNSTYGSATTLMYQMDNEPDIWLGTHAELFPTPPPASLTYDYVTSRNIATATMVKSIAPSAQVLGYVGYGWAGYVELQNSPDYNSATPDVWFIDYFLQQAKAAETAAGHRVIDDLDLHWYPEATDTNNVRITSTPANNAAAIAAAQAARVQAPRSLWDTTYTESSWITADSTNGPIELLPRIFTKIAADYPNTNLSFTEWDYGGHGDISGAVAGADVLGIFGSNGVWLATNWDDSGQTAGVDNSNFLYAAFRIYRNYDGADATFGDWSISAASSNAATGSVYASVSSSDPTHVVIVAINKATTAQNAGITIAHPTSFSTMTVYQLTSASSNITKVATAINKTATNAFVYNMPAMSVSVLVPSP